MLAMIDDYDDDKQGNLKTCLREVKSPSENPSSSTTRTHIFYVVIFCLTF